MKKVAGFIPSIGPFSVKFAFWWNCGELLSFPLCHLAAVILGAGGSEKLMHDVEGNSR